MFLTIAFVLVSIIIYFILTRKSCSRITTSKYVFITGCDSGFGYNTATQLDHLGFSVIATCLTSEGEDKLRKNCSDRLDVINMDVTDTKQVQKAFEFVKEQIKSDDGLWAVINNAGVCRIGPLDWQSLDAMKKMADVNLWGLVDVTKTFLSLLKISGGRLVNVSSVGGRLSLPNMGAYCMSKFAVEAFTDALRVELCHWKMKVILIEPGFYRTSMTAKNNLSFQLDDMWSRISQEKKSEYGEEFLKQSGKHEKFLNLKGNLLFRGTNRKWLFLQLMLCVMLGRKGSVGLWPFFILRMILTAKQNILSGVVDTCASENVFVVTEAIIHAVTSANPRVRYVLGWDANILWLGLSRLPSNIGDFLKRHICRIVVPANAMQR